MRASFETLFLKHDSASALKAVQRVKEKERRELDRQGNTLLGIAAWYGHEEACRWLLDEGCSLEQRDARGQTPLLVALDSLSADGPGDFVLRTALFLLERGANVLAADDEGWTALHRAARSARRFPEVLDAVLERQPD